MSDITLKKILSNDRISTGLVDRLYSSNNVTASNPRTFLIQSLGRKLFNSFCLEISMTVHKFEKLGLILKS